MQNLLIIKSPQREENLSLGAPKDRGNPHNWTWGQRRMQTERSAQILLLSLSRSPAQETPRAGLERTLRPKSSAGPFIQMEGQRVLPRSTVCVAWKLLGFIRNALTGMVWNKNVCVIICFMNFSDIQIKCTLLFIVILSNLLIFKEWFHGFYWAVSSQIMVIKINSCQLQH